MNLYLALPFFGFLLASILGLLTLSKNRRSTVHQTFGLFLIFGGLWDLTIFFMRSSPDAQAALMWENFVLVAISFSTVFLYHFSVVYSNNKLPTAAIVVMYLYPAIVALLGHAGIIMPAMQRMSYGWAPVPTPLFLIIVVGFYFFAISALINLHKAYIRFTTHVEKNRTIYIIIGLYFCVLGGIADILPVVGLPLYPGAIFGNIIFAILATIAILKHQLLDIQIVIRKSVAYFLISTIIAVPFVGIIFLLNEVLGRQEYTIWVYGLLLVILSIVLLPLWSRIQVLVDKWFYRERWEHFKALEQFSRETKEIADLPNLSDSFVSLVSQAMQTEDSCLLLLDDSRKCFSVTASYALPKALKFSFLYDSAIAAWLSKHEGFLSRRQMDILPQLQAITLKERNILDLMKADLLIPLKASKILIGILIIGPKRSNRAYSADDLRLLDLVSQHMAVTLDNARLYGDLKRTYSELYETQENLIAQSEKLRVLGEMTTGIAHNFNNTLTVILGRAQLALAEMEEADNKHDVELIERAALDAAKMVHKLQDYARVRVDDHMDIADLNDLIKISLEFIRPKLDEQCEITGSSIDVVLDLNEIGLIEGCATEIREALVNILINSIEAMPQGGTLSIGSKQDGDFVAVSISDTGIGMTDDMQRKVFNPFFTTKGLRGLGMGLSIVRGTIDRHHGQITVTSEPKKGTTFSIKIPVTHKLKLEGASVMPDKTDITEATILIVDDDEGPREVLRRILSKAGYNVDVADGGKEGLSMIKQKDYSLILADLGMPDVSGWDIASQVKNSNPGTAVVLVTGWGVQIDKDKLKERGVHNVVNKPFTAESLMTVINEILDDKRASHL